MSAIALGTANITTKRRPQSIMLENLSESLAALAAASCGISTTPKATPSIAVGNSINSPALFSQVTEPVPKWDAICVLMSSEICETLTPSKAGPIRCTILFVAGCAQAARAAAIFNRTLGARPMRHMANKIATNCKMPPSITPPAMA